MSAISQRLARARAAALRTRNTHKKPGKAVTPAEVLRYVKEGHRACRGTLVKPAGLIFDASKGSHSYCRCATEAFMKAHPEAIIGEGGQAFWPAPDEDDDG